MAAIRNIPCGIYNSPFHVITTMSFVILLISLLVGKYLVIDGMGGIETEHNIIKTFQHVSLHLK